MGHTLAVAGLAVLCGLWVVLQSWFARRDPDAPGVEGKCGGCGGGCRSHEPH